MHTTRPKKEEGTQEKCVREGKNSSSSFHFLSLANGHFAQPPSNFALSHGDKNVIGHSFRASRVVFRTTPRISPRFMPSIPSCRQRVQGLLATRFHRFPYSHFRTFACPTLLPKFISNPPPRNGLSTVGVGFSTSMQRRPHAPVGAQTWQVGSGTQGPQNSHDVMSRDVIAVPQCPAVDTQKRAPAREQHPNRATAQAQTSPVDPAAPSG